MPITHGVKVKAIMKSQLVVVHGIIIMSLLTGDGLTLMAQSVSSLKLENLLVENRSNPLGIDERQPRLSWQIISSQRNVRQKAYHVRAAESSADLEHGRRLLWDSGKMASDQSVHIGYQGPALQSGQRLYWQVRVWDGDDKPSEWSKPAYWEMALLRPSDWQAVWIQPNIADDTARSQPCPLLRKEFTLHGAVKSARVYVTSLGLYEMELNGHRVGDQVFTPGWTSYSKRLQYQTYDVTNQLRPGKNAIGVMLGDGWYRGYITWDMRRNFYGDRLALLLQLHLVYENGSTQIIATDETWKASTGPILSSDIYNGEIYDARLEKKGWSTPDFNDTGWSGVKVIEHSKTILVAPAGPPVRKIQELKPVAIFKTPAGETVFDMGQNMVGWVRLKVQGRAGETVTLHHTEVLNKDGNLYRDNLRKAEQKTQYTLKGGGLEVYEPRFTFQGFRYVNIAGFPGEPALEDLTGIVIHSDMAPTGSFECSHPLLNQLQHNIQWGQKGNFLDVPTDCPQRDERMGWTGDAQVFSRTAAFNMNVHSFFAKWLRDVEADQQPNGSVPFVIPNVLAPTAGGATGWADVATIIPWNMYLAYGDKKILEQQYASMKAWVGYMQQNSSDYLWNKGFHFGDWLFYRPEDDNDGRSAVTNKYLIAQCFFAHSTHLVMNTAEVLGKKEEAAQYAELLRNIKEAFVKEYVTPSGQLVSSTQTAYVLALNFDMLPEALRQQLAERLVQNIKSYNNHLTTGFLGTPYLCHVLTRFGYTDVAYALLMQETYPSWLYPVKMGATTIWERWDGIKPDSTFQTPGMNSFNHYAYGAIGDWMYRVIAGIDTDESGPGYKRIKIKPHMSGSLTFVRAELLTYYGKVSSHWKSENGKLQLEVEIPANTQATVYIPAPALASVEESKEALATAKDLKVKGKEGDYIAVAVGSGSYHFTWDRP
ncbi:MAG: family 78 glycoside hydrolase catalytic domain [bacterium]